MSGPGFTNLQGGIRKKAGEPITYGESQASGPAPTTAGHHKHDIMNKLDPRVDSTKDRRPLETGSHHHHHNDNNVSEGTYGPHKSRMANALDPRVDSDLDSTATGKRGGSIGAGTGMGTSSTYGTGTGPSTAAMHGGAGPVGSGMGVGGATGTGGGFSGRSNPVPEGTYGPHSSRTANALDPRVDSDRDGMMGMGVKPAPQQQQTYGNTSTGLGTSGPAPNTSGPHRSDMMNKLDPTVDSKAGTHGHSNIGTGTGTRY